MSNENYNSSSIQEQQTLSALSDELESFLRSFKDRNGDYKYFDKKKRYIFNEITEINNAIKSKIV